MKKKLLIIFFVVLIVIFLIMIFNNENIEDTVNNTIEYLDKNDYKYELTLKDIYYVNNKKMSSKIKYIETKNNDLYRFELSNYVNSKRLDYSKYYIKNTNNKYLYYTFNGKSYEEKEIDNLEKDFDISIKNFFKKIQKIDKIKKHQYKVKVSTKDAFRIIYGKDSSINVKDKVTVYITTENNKIKSISFNSKEKNKNEYYNINLNIDYSINEIDFDTK